MATLVVLMWRPELAGRALCTLSLSLQLVVSRMECEECNPTTRYGRDPLIVL